MSGQIQYGLARALTSEGTPDGSPDAELTQRLGTFRHEFHLAGFSPTREDLERLLERARELQLQDEQIRDELAEIHAALGALDFAAEIAAKGAPTVASIAELPAGETCHFVTPARFGRRRSDQFGHLELTTTWLKFRGALDVSIVWSEVEDVRRTGRDIEVALTESRRPLRFACATLSEAVHGSVLAKHLLAEARTKASGPTAVHGAL